MVRLSLPGVAGLLAFCLAACRSQPPAPRLTPAEGRELARAWQRFLTAAPDWPKLRAGWLARSQPARNLLVENLIRYMAESFYANRIAEANRAAAELVLLDRLALDHLLAVLAADRNALGLRQLAAGCLVRIGSPAVPGLIAALNAPRYPARRLAAKALGAIRDPRAFEPLVARLRGDGNLAVRVACVEALAQLPGAPVDEVLVATLEDGDPWVAAAAAAALGRRGTVQAVRPLAHRLLGLGGEGPEKGRGRLAQALRKALHRLTGLPETSPPQAFLSWRPEGRENP